MSWMCGGKVIVVEYKIELGYRKAKQSKISTGEHIHRTDRGLANCTVRSKIGTIRGNLQTVTPCIP